MLHNALNTNGLDFDFPNLDRAMVNAIASTFSDFAENPGDDQTFLALLGRFLELTTSQYGFIVEVDTAIGPPAVIRIRALRAAPIQGSDADSAVFTYWLDSGETRRFCVEELTSQLAGGATPLFKSFHAPSTRQGRQGSSALTHAVLGLPVHFDGRMVAIVGLVSTSSLYEQTIVDFVDPLLKVLGQQLHTSRLSAQVERHQIELERLALVARHTLSGVVITDAAGRVEWVNNAFSQYCGYGLAEISGRTPGSLLQGPLTDPRTVIEMHDAVAAARSFQVEVLNYHKNGQERWVNILCNPLFDSAGGIRGFISIQTDITAGVNARAKLRSFRHVLDHTLDCVFMFDAQSLLFTYVNAGSIRQLGFSQDELLRLHPYDIKPSFPEPLFREMVAPLIKGQSPFLKFETVHRHKNGSLVPVEIFLQYFQPEGEPPCFVAIVRDINERLEAQSALAHQAEFTKAVLANVAEGIISINPAGEVLSVNFAAEEIFGYSSTELISQNVKMIMPAEHARQHDQYLANYQRTRIPKVIGKGRELEGLRKNGERFPLRLAVTEIDYLGDTAYVASIQDITQYRSDQEKLERLAHSDALTGLANRTALNHNLHHAIIRADRNKQQVALLYIDLDRFKQVNDSFGHLLGDELIHLVAQKLASRARKTDCLGRLGGDELLLILENITTDAMVADIASSLIELFSEQPFTLSNGAEIFVGMSIGISLYPDNAQDPLALIGQADMAMYRAKAEGRNTFRFFNQNDGLHARESLSLETRMRRGLEKEEFLLYYQPLVSQGKVVSFEALLRWAPDGGSLIGPDKFIPIAEETGMIVPLGAWALREACRQAKAWQGTGYPGLCIAVNLSVRQFRSPQLLPLIEEVLQKTGLAAECLELELTESMFMDGVAQAIDTLHALKAIGVMLSIDDFGTGYSSLSYLTRFPIDKLKIDQSFIAGLHSNSSDNSIVSAIIAMGKALRMKVVAEGVETDSQRIDLEMMNCDQFQGYLFRRPAPADEVTAWLSEQPR